MKLNKSYKHSFFLLFLLLLFFCFSFLIFRYAPDYLIRLAIHRKYILSNTGTTGDTFGGTLGPLIAWLAAFLTFAAFWVQYKSNLQQRQQIDEQGKETAIDRFENKYFELLRLHRSNVDEMNIQDIIKQRKVFIAMFYEFRYIYYLAEKYYIETEKTELDIIDKKEIANLSYLLFFFGVGYNSDKAHSELFEKYLGKAFFIALVEKLKHIKINYKDWHLKPGIDGRIEIKSKDDRDVIFKVKYKPFNGHADKLGYYFRHLFQAVKFVDEQKGKYFTSDIKYEYIKTIRAQLSNFEQLLLYYNQLSVIGSPWKKYIQEYHLIKNIPLPYADFGVIPETFFASDIILTRKKPGNKEFFEWYEIKRNIKETY